ncbi:MULTISPECIES: outer membrane protein assembly factor BamB [Pseudomonas]|uniref:Outer membrane protein assembly factor BamB n=1 Tax=Pseudomonas nitroreducens TaxID=46680 RepID=A0A2D0AD76_PSENT|nr:MULTISPECIES: outer membrane protein assembly factor BamB [Pseudomonas]MCG8906378.1 outer membrane protein assembly factor BamB [Pseudomonas sp. DP-17]MDU4250812.1 outer membrane protein assembly factor BamB [Pseudomonas sp.]OWP49600.1 outer membrane protein assembly factor BamB [Pseudomonas nitroreducens]
MLRWKHVALLALTLMAVGCSSNSKKELPPAELTDFKEEVRLEKQWSRSVGDGQGDLYNLLEPAVDGQTIYAASAEGRVMAMQRETGEVLWKKDLDLPISGAVGVGSGMVLLGTLRGDVIALDSGSGEQKWRAKVTSEVLAAPATNGDVVVVQTQDDKLIGFDASTGNQRWIYEGTVPVLTLRGTGAPLIAGRLALAGLASGKVVAVDVERGLPVWEARVAIPQGRSELDRVVDIDGGLLLVDNVLYVASYQGRAAALDVGTGRVLWQREASSYVGVAEGTGSVFISQSSGTVESLDSRGSSSLWSNDALARRQLSAPAVLSSNVVVGDLEGYVHLLSQVDGRFVGREKVDGDGVRVRPLVVGSWMYVFGNSGKLVAYTIR